MQTNELLRLSMMKAPSISDIGHAIRTKMIRGESAPIYAQLWRTLHDKGLQQFDFGYVSKDMFVWAAEVREELGVVTPPPFELCLYRHSVDVSEEVGSAKPITVAFTILVDHRPGIARDATEQVALSCSLYAMSSLHGDIALSWFGLDTKGKLVCTEQSREVMDTAVSFYREIALLSFMLSIKSVERRTEAPSVKLNTSRVKQGKLPIPYITYVDLSALRSNKPRGDGTHASPRPHVRRAHMRRLAGDNPRIVPVAASLVNADGTPMMREEYRIKKIITP